MEASAIKQLIGCSPVHTYTHTNRNVAAATIRLKDYLYEMASSSSSAGYENKSNEKENREAIHTEAESGPDLPLLDIEEILQKLNNGDPEIRFHIVQSLRKHTTKSPQVASEIVAKGTLVPMLVSSLRSLSVSSHLLSM